MTKDSKPIAIYYEHPEWFRALFAELDGRGLPYERVDASRHRYEPGAREDKYSLVFNRMSASAHLRGHANAVFYTRDYLAHLEAVGVRVVNGYESFLVETSKARQLRVFDSLGLGRPRTRIINSASEAVGAACDFRFPVIVKPNIGGRGAGVVRFDTPEALRAGAREGLFELGVDSTALVQEFSPARGGHITRVETLGGKYLYAIRVSTSGENFNLCPAEFCQIEDDATVDDVGAARGASDNAAEGVAAVGEMCIADAPKSGLKVEAYEPPAEVVAQVERIAAAAHLDLGGVEYLIDERDGRQLFYDINALSNFVADAVSVVGFDPHARLADYLEQEAGRCATATGSRSSAAG
jgi:hypothetical protein